MMHEIKVVIKAKLQARGCRLPFKFKSLHFIFIFDSQLLLDHTKKPKVLHGATGSRFTDKQRKEDTFTGAWCFCLPRPTLELCHIPIIMM